MNDWIKTDIVVIGSGIAGLTFALESARLGMKVVILTKNETRESNTNYAQGGIAAVVTDNDSFDLHVKDTLVAGAGLCDKSAVECIVHQAPEAIAWLIEQGTNFSKTHDKALEVGREGGHSRHRIVHAKDLTGREIERALTDAVSSHPLITTIEHAIALDLSFTSGVECTGITAFIPHEHRLLSVTAKATMLATGGCGQVYAHTTNPSIATGDGYAIAARAGAELKNMEFVQFHPTSLYHPNAHSFLISEAVRGFGCELKRRDGSTFMEEYHPLGSLAPRDIVARAIVREMRLSGDTSMFLDCTAHDEDTLRAHFPTIFEECLRWGIDISKEMIPVVPAAHYECGGIVTDLHARTSIKRLYACGEVACTGVHGANRLASNSLLEAVVFAKAAAQDVIHLPEVTSGIVLHESNFSTQKGALTTSIVHLLKQEIQEVMWKNVGIVRHTQELEFAQNRLLAMADEIEYLYRHNELTLELIEVRNMTQTALLIASGAASRTENCGLHFNVNLW
ncbi:MAG: L-aspartate oxidase [Ignavibacteria bacterium]|nr:L-aspartate oxidase [Ignavibacteria bacterium]